jgi:hypothetical protein
MDVSKNVIHNLEVIPYVYLKHLNLSYNHFVIIRGSFSLLGGLEILDISHGHIQSIKESTFVGLRNLKHLYLGWNPLLDIELNVDWKSPFNGQIDVGNNATQCCMLEQLHPHQCLERLDKLLSDCTYKISSQAIRVLATVLSCSGILGNLYQFIREFRRRKDDALRFVLICNAIISSFIMCAYQLTIGITSFTSSKPILDSVASYTSSSFCKFLLFFVLFCTFSSISNVFSLAVLTLILPSLMFSVKMSHILVKVAQALCGLTQCVFPLSIGLHAIFNYPRYERFLDILCHPMKVLFQSPWDAMETRQARDADIQWLVLGTIVGVTVSAASVCSVPSSCV